MLKNIVVIAMFFCFGVVFCKNTIAQTSDEFTFTASSKGYEVRNDKRNVIKNRVQIYVSVMSSSVTKVDEISIEIEGIADIAQTKINKNIKEGAYLPQLVYDSVQNLAERIFYMKNAKTKEEFEKAVVLYENEFSQDETIVSLNGYHLVKHTWMFQK